MASKAIFERRRHNLDQAIQQLVQQRHFDNGKALCEHYQLSAAYISQLITTQRQIGEKTARDLEQQLQLPSGYLDQQHLAALQQNPEGQGIACYDMQMRQTQLFQRSALNKVSITFLANFIASPAHYLLQINTTDYEPVLKQHWYALLLKQHHLQRSDLVCVNLNNDLCLLLQYQQTEQRYLHFQALDATRQVKFHEDDIASIDVLVALFAQHQIQAFEA